MATFAPANQIRGRIAAYKASSTADIDEALTRLTASWAALLKMSPPTDKMRGDYDHDVDLLLDARARLARVTS